MTARTGIPLTATAPVRSCDRRATSTGATGATGAGGATGADGSYGCGWRAGCTGCAGLPGPGGLVRRRRRRPGPTGATGADGKSVLNGTGRPTTTAGNDGDFYIDTATSTIYGPKASTLAGQRRFADRRGGCRRAPRVPTGRPAPRVRPVPRVRRVRKASKGRRVRTVLRVPTGATGATGDGQVRRVPRARPVRRAPRGPAGTGAAGVPAIAAQTGNYTITHKRLHDPLQQPGWCVEDDDAAGCSRKHRPDLLHQAHRRQRLAASPRQPAARPRRRGRSDHRFALSTPCPRHQRNPGAVGRLDVVDHFAPQPVILQQHSAGNATPPAPRCRFLTARRDRRRLLFCARRSSPKLRH